MCCKAWENYCIISAAKLVISKRTCAALSFDFKFTRMPDFKSNYFPLSSISITNHVPRFGCF